MTYLTEDKNGLPVSQRFFMLNLKLWPSFSAILCNDAKVFVGYG